jgi:hypothetical protein
VTRTESGSQSLTYDSVSLSPTAGLACLLDLTSPRAAVAEKENKGAHPLVTTLTATNTWPGLSNLVLKIALRDDYPILDRENNETQIWIACLSSQGEAAEIILGLRACRLWIRVYTGCIPSSGTQPPNAHRVAGEENASRDWGTSMVRIWGGPSSRHKEREKGSGEGGREGAL